MTIDVKTEDLRSTSTVWTGLSEDEYSSLTTRAAGFTLGEACWNGPQLKSAVHSAYEEVRATLHALARDGDTELEHIGAALHDAARHYDETDRELEYEFDQR